MSDIYATVGQRTGQQTRTNASQVANHEGGMVYQTTDQARLLRFLTLGATSGTFYVGREAHLLENVEFLRRMAVTQPKTYLSTVVGVSVEGRAHRQQPGLLALAVAAASDDASVRASALAALPQVARTGSTLLTFVQYVTGLRGWGRGLRRAVGDWYLSKDPQDAAYQMVKYRGRSGWTHRDVLRVAHPQTADPAFNALFRWALGNDWGSTDMPELVETFERLKTADVDGAVRLIEGPGPSVSWEMLPDHLLNEPRVWEVLLAWGVPTGALLRQVPRLTRLGLLADGGEWQEHVTSRLTHDAALRKARLHPMALLMAARTYARGHGRGSQVWEPVREVTEALEAGFYAAFSAVQPVGAPVVLALDVSGSMGWGQVGDTGLTPREASAALALVTANTEAQIGIVGFSHKLVDVPIRPGMSLGEAVRAVSGIPMGGTDTAKPWQWLTASKHEVAGVVTYTDNETWAGPEHTDAALRRYREHVNPAARSVVVGMTSTGFTVAGPADMGSLDVAGLDAGTPGMISDFLRAGTDTP